MLTERLLAEIIDSIRYRDWAFVAKSVRSYWDGEDGSPSGFLIWVEFVAKDFKTNQQTVVTGRKWYLSRWATKSEVVQTCLLAVLVAIEHEVREEFSYQDKSIFGPHFDVDALVLYEIPEDLRADPEPPPGDPSAEVRVATFWQRVLGMCRFTESGN